MSPAGKSAKSSASQPLVLVAGASSARSTPVTPAVESPEPLYVMIAKAPSSGSSAPRVSASTNSRSVGATCVSTDGPAVSKNGNSKRCTVTSRPARAATRPTYSAESW